ncbi:MAG: sigma-70 family RNA polymerase sigma factor [Bacteroidales bacterium]|nr:sigma-70 family RNA polymerase sigma factor [Bacteroidales bacterium]
MAQREVYDMYAPIMRGICLRYTGTAEAAKDMLQEGFIKVFTKISQYKGEGSFEGWIKRIMINTAISYHKSKKHINNVYLLDNVNNVGLKEEEEEMASMDCNIKENEFNYEAALSADLNKEELLSILNSIAEPFKLVFNLFYLEDYKHKDIAQLLNIDENTSRSRLSRARKLIQKELYKRVLEKVTA